MKSRVAIIDDEATLCKELSRALASEGFEVETFQSGKKSLVRMACFPFDLAIIDLRLPDMNGIDILRKIRAEQPDSEAVVMTG